MINLFLFIKIFGEASSPLTVVDKRIFLISNAIPIRPMMSKMIAKKPMIHSIMMFKNCLLCSLQKILKIHSKIIL